MRKMTAVALALVGVMTLSIPAKADNYYIYSPKADAIKITYDNRTTTYDYSNHSVTNNNNYNYKITIKSNGNKTPKVTIKPGGSGGGNGGNVSVAEPPYYHTITKAPGLDCVNAVGQGGKLVICGVKTRATFVMRETTSGKVASAKVLAAQIGGSVKNVVETYAPGVRFSKAQVDFKVYGAHDGDIYKVYQMGPNGTWQEVQVDETREGHVICTVYKTGTFAFIKMN
ncbi:hypothetical protein [Butyrivibrio sp. JL13D10]|uniref:hypothetical protein n=1 Tax=Butyrivibrio sp. JL13D10 TaxID=3236815 RepID=UPI0038B6307D